MKIKVLCLQCAQESGEVVAGCFVPHDTGEVGAREADFLLCVGEIGDGGIIEAECKNGHKSAHVLIEPLFDLMFELASLAFIDGYYREAVIGFTTAIERIYEFYVRVITRRHAIAADAYKAAWKGINRSERQLGAFLICYLLDRKDPFDHRPLDQFVRLRNRATHEGYLPTKSEALAYGTIALSEMHRILKALFPEAERSGLDGAGELMQIQAVLVAEQRALLGGRNAVSFSRKTIVASGSPHLWGKETFEAALQKLRAMQSSLYVKEA